jgi:sarcosine oxidase
MTTCDLAIVGLGAVGSSALLAAARETIDVLGLDRYAPPHTHGSTHGETRIVRAAIGEGLAYTPLALRSFALWDELSRETGIELINRCGFLILGGVLPHAMHVPEGFVETTIKAARHYGIAHESLTASEVHRRFPAFRTFEGHDAYFEPGAGLAYPERIVAAQLERAKQLGARTLLNTHVLDLRQEGPKIRVVTEQGDVIARRIILAPGAWIKTFLPAEWAVSLRVLRQSVHWFDVDRAVRQHHLPARMPAFVWNDIYGFPIVGSTDAGIKIATENMTEEMDPGDPSREVTERDVEIAAAKVRAAFPQCGAHLRGSVCLYTITPDTHFRIGKHPLMERVTAITACSGHGFKHAAALGEALVNKPETLSHWTWT